VLTQGSKHDIWEFGVTMARPTRTEMTITHVQDVQHTSNGHPFVECQTSSGTVAFWGSPQNMKNILAIQQAQTPFVIVCDSIKSSRPNHHLWVPESGVIFSINPVLEKRSPDIGPTGTRTQRVSTEELAQWRRIILRILRELERQQECIESSSSVAYRIKRLSESNIIPRETCAFMRAITEMRNVTEYESKVLSVTESEAVRAAWLAIQEWWVQTQRCSD
jgi:hypothetical protein